MSLKRATTLAVGMLCLMKMALATAAVVPTTISPQCKSPNVRQLDFWVGDWDTVETVDIDGKSIAFARVELIAEGCGLHELYIQNDGLVGDSILNYDPVLKQWQQKWITNRGSVMTLAGAFRGEVLVLEGEVHLANGTTVLQRISWQQTEKGVREWAEVSKDGGSIWSPAFDVTFVKRAVE